MNEVEKRDAPAPASGSDPFAAFRAEMDRVFQSFLGPHSGFRVAAPAPRAALTPTVDVTESEAALIIAAELPGMVEADIDISINADVLTLSGEKRVEKNSEEDDVHIVERRFGSVRRSFRLPDTIDVDGATAQFENGVLKITLPKKPEIAAKSRKVEISKT